MNTEQKFELLAFEYLQLIGEEEIKRFWDKIEQELNGLSETEKLHYQNAMHKHLQKIKSDLQKIKNKSTELSV